MINKLLIVGGYSAALGVPPRRRPGDKFTCDWSLMGRNRPPIPSPWQPALSPAFKQSAVAFHCLLLPARRGGRLVVAICFCPRAQARPGHEYLWGDTGTKGRAEGAPWRPWHWNGDIWSVLTPSSPTKSSLSPLLVPGPVRPGLFIPRPSQRAQASPPPPRPGPRVWGFFLAEISAREH